MFQSAKIKCLLSPCICVLYIFFANSTNTECNYICTCIFVIIWHMIWQCHINDWAFLRSSQTASAMCCYLPWRMTRRTALITPPPPPDHGKSPGWHMTRAWFGKKTAVVWPWGKELKIYLHKELKRQCIDISKLFLDFCFDPWAMRFHWRIIGSRDLSFCQKKVSLVKIDEEFWAVRECGSVGLWLLWFSANLRGIKDPVPPAVQVRDRLRP